MASHYYDELLIAKLLINPVGKVLAEHGKLSLCHGNRKGRFLMVSSLETYEFGAGTFQKWSTSFTKMQQQNVQVFSLIFFDILVVR